ncbi:hypothetical protein SAMN05878281_3240 [Salegentibacter salegens]|uniref:Uncharacterized protein n=1 Tax=Salegentibacter salegens TaxID=143223 RepID=A0A1M7NKB1_9FLAO|nr:hypothetical protein SAMN05878281_3240 [Salegentibacter salegens]
MLKEGGGHFVCALLYFLKLKYTELHKSPNLDLQNISL